MFGSWHSIAMSIKCGVKMVFARKACILWIFTGFWPVFDVNVISFWLKYDHMHLRQLWKAAIFRSHSIQTHTISSCSHVAAADTAAKWRSQANLAAHHNSVADYENMPDAPAGTHIILLAKIYNENCNKTINYMHHYRKYTNKIMLTACNPLIFVVSGST